MQPLPIRRCTVIAGDGSATVSRIVSCPSVGRSVSALACARCQHLDSLTSQAVHCSPPVLPPERDARADLRERAVRARVGDLVSTQVVCARSDTSVEEATSLLVEHDLRCLPIVDAAHKLVGIVTRADLLRQRFMDVDCETRGPGHQERGFHVQEIASGLVTEVMTPRVHALPEDAPLAYAVALMAADEVHEVPVVTHDGAVVGILTALDALHWLAEELGYRLSAKAGNIDRKEAAHAV
jgi:CBS domain-containing protein